MSTNIIFIYSDVNIFVGKKNNNNNNCTNLKEIDCGKWMFI